MRKLFAIGLSLALLLSSAGCSSKTPQVNQSVETTQATTQPAIEVVTEEVKVKLDDVLKQNKFTGIVQLTHNGEVVYTSVSGNNDLGEPLTIDSPMYMASVSKQFCAAAILILRDQGKLSLNDTLDLYFPEYTTGKEITIENLLTMHSGLPRDATLDLEDPQILIEKTEAENIAAAKEWIFRQPLKATPGSKTEYSNVNYTLLALIVEAASGQNYRSFIRQSIFEPLGMTHSGFVIEVADSPDWAKGLNYDRVDLLALIPGVLLGCGDVVSTAGDMDLWMNALQNGQVVCEESYREMVTMVDGYGYGVMSGMRGGKAHGGTLPSYTSYVYFNEEYGFNFFAVTGDTPSFNPNLTTQASTAFLNTLYQAVDAAEVEQTEE